MDGIREFLDAARPHAPGRLRGVFHIAIGRRVSRIDGTVVTAGVTWRKLSLELKAARYDKDLVAELGVDPEALSPRDRERFWYAAISLAKVDSIAARAQAEQLAGLLSLVGLAVGPAPTPPPVAVPPPTYSDDDAARKRKKK